eukprot:SAG11_NODE_172_length_13574_cov_14.732690_2_plen_128_part_00
MAWLALPSQESTADHATVNVAAIVRGKMVAADWKKNDEMRLVDAAGKGDDKTVLRLLNANIAVDCISNGTTPLFCAARQGYTQCVLHLLQHGAAVNKSAETHETPLMAAVAEVIVPTSRQCCSKELI